MKTLLQLLLAHKLIASKCVLFQNNLLPSDTVPLKLFLISMAVVIQELGNAIYWRTRTTVCRNKGKGMKVIFRMQKCMP